MYFDRFVRLLFFMSLLFASLNLLQMHEIPPLNPFSPNKYMSMSEICSNFISVIFKITSQLNPGENKDKDLVCKISNKY